VTSFLIILSVLLVSAIKVASTNLSFGHQFICIFIYWVEICLGIIVIWIARSITNNGPAIWGGCVPAFCHKKRDGACFCRHGTNFIECWRDRGTSSIGAANLSLVTNLVAGTGAVSRYKLSRSQKLVTVQDLNCVLMRVSGCNNHYEFVLGAGAKAKTVTNNLPILSVLLLVILFFFFGFSPVNMLTIMKISYCKLF